MSGMLEPLRFVLSKKHLRPVRDAIIRFAWRLDPDLSALGWLPADILMSLQRRRSAFSWNQYHKLGNELRKQLENDPEWRQGAAKSWLVANGPLNAMKYLRKPAGRALDFGCGSHFSDSTAIILYLFGADNIDCIDLIELDSGFDSSDSHELVHWFEDRILRGETMLIPGGPKLNRERLDELHRLAAREKNPESSAKRHKAIHLIRGDLMKQGWKDGRYDLIFSNAVLEHVTEPQMIFTELFRLLKPGGVMHHQIDFKDHRWYSDKEKYPMMGRADSPHGWSDPLTNGLRYGGWKRIVSGLDGIRMLKSDPHDKDGKSLSPKEAGDENTVFWEFTLRKSP